MSGDVFLGVPFNMASYALLTHMLAYVTNLKVGEYVHTFGDAHLYENHLPQVEEMLSREPKALPKLTITYGTSIDHFKVDHLRLEGYDPHPPLKGEVAI